MNDIIKHKSPKWENEFNRVMNALNGFLDECEAGNTTKAELSAKFLYIVAGNVNLTDTSLGYIETMRKDPSINPVTRLVLASMLASGKKDDKVLERACRFLDNSKPKAALITLTDSPDHNNLGYKLMKVLGITGKPVQFSLF